MPRMRATPPHHHEDHGTGGERNDEGHCRRKTADPEAGDQDEANDRGDDVLAGHGSLQVTKPSGSASTRPTDDKAARGLRVEQG